MPENTPVGAQPEVERRPASQNPWYVLATIYGEQEEVFDEDLHAQNRRIWNGWACGHLPEAERKALAKRIEVDDAELDPWNDDERATVETTFADRLGPEVGIPNYIELFDFRLCRFDQPVYMRRFVFSGNANFDSTVFNGDAHFGSAIFIESAILSLAQFIGNVDFRSTSFYRSSSFRSAKFSAVADFTRAYISGNADFRSAAFGGYTDFDSTIFLNGADFSFASFSRDARFISTAFFNKTDFAATTFTESVTFTASCFLKEVDFYRAAFHRYCYFTACLFEKQADFTDTNFHHTTSFREARFVSEFPLLSGAILHQNTIFTAKDFIDRILNKKESDNGPVDESAEGTTNGDLGTERKERIQVRRRLWPSTKAVDPEPSRESVAIIRHAVSKQGTPEEEHFFFRREMALRARIDGFWRRLPYRVFGLFSDFGYSIQRPVYSLLALFLVFGVIFAAAGYGGYWVIDTRDPLIKGFVAPFGLSFANIFAFFGFQRLYAPDILKQAPWWLIVASGIQTVLGFILLFFLGLGLRTRFRLR